MTYIKQTHTGIWPALLTPLNSDLSINIPALASHIQHLLVSGCQGVTLFGTTGEGPSFSSKERMETLEGLIKAGVSAEKILVHTGAAALPDVIQLSQHATAHGVHGCLVMPPFFFKGVTEQGIFNFYQQLVSGVASSHLKLVLYHLPQVSCVPLTCTIIKKMIQEYPDTILGIKDSGCNREESIALCKAVAPVQVWVGNEPDLQVMATLGSKGAVSGVANILPLLVQKLIGDQKSSHQQQDQEQILSFLSIFDQFPMLQAFKAMLSFTYNDSGWLRMRAPLVALSDDQIKDLKQLSAQLGFNYST